MNVCAIYLLIEVWMGCLYNAQVEESVVHNVFGCYVGTYVGEGRDGGREEVYIQRQSLLWNMLFWNTSYFIYFDIQLLKIQSFTKVLILYFVPILNTVVWVQHFSSCLLKSTWYGIKSILKFDIWSTSIFAVLTTLCRYKQGLFCQYSRSSFRTAYTQHDSRNYLILIAVVLHINCSKCIKLAHGTEIVHICPLPSFISDITALV